MGKMHFMQVKADRCVIEVHVYVFCWNFKKFHRFSWFQGWLPKLPFWCFYFSFVSLSFLIQCQWPAQGIKLCMTCWQTPNFSFLDQLCMRMGSDIASWRMSTGLFYGVMYGMVTKSFVGKISLNFIFLLIVFFCLKKLFWQSSSISKTPHDLNRSAAEVRINPMHYWISPDWWLTLNLSIYLSVYLSMYRSTDRLINRSIDLFRS